MNVRYIVPSMTSREAEALSLLTRCGQVDGAHHKAWVIDQVTRILAGEYYDLVVSEAKAGEDGPDTYDWDEGVPP